ncbi:hypothetical protein QBC37DRAFT_396890 [Rhypophila decipiens]|uniref:Uncharacterized protein n=1 Tax=Rhypophila decipiens TaxID=261697 RepID=A0AAN6YDA1_9PEZI|nr:hypothetical protein QBC37DRAFT_396890 [Rhypophila decipiens]
MTFGTYSLSKDRLTEIAREYIAQDFTLEEIESLPYNLYTVLGVKLDAGYEACFDAWCAQVNIYNTDPYWNTVVPSDWPDRLQFKKSLEVAAKMLFTVERRRLYDIHYYVSNCVAVDWSKADLTSQERDFMMQMVMHKFTSTKVTVDNANSLYNSFTQRATAARNAAQEQLNRELQYFQKLPAAGSAFAAAAGPIAAFAAAAR